MIALTIAGCCAHCEYIDLQLRPRQYGLTGRKIYELECIHQEVCGKLQEEAIKHPLYLARDEED